jgi:hypothetical protein
MSLLPTGLTVLAASLEGLLNPVAILPRNIGGFIADITVEELHTDKTTITRHPVEQGAAITDHAIIEPSEVTIRAGWSNSSLQSGGDPNYVQQIYAAFLALRASRTLFDIQTGKRFYENMLIEDLTQRTDKDTENSMMLVCRCRQLLIVNTQTVTVPDAANMKSPQINAATQNNGTQALAPAPNFNATSAP